MPPRRTPSPGLTGQRSHSAWAKASPSPQPSLKPATRSLPAPQAAWGSNHCPFVVLASSAWLPSPGRTRLHPLPASLWTLPCVCGSQGGTHVHGAGGPAVTLAIGEAHRPRGAAAPFPDNLVLVAPGTGFTWEGPGAEQRVRPGRQGLPDGRDQPPPWTRPLTCRAATQGAAAIRARPSLGLWDKGPPSGREQPSWTWGTGAGVDRALGRGRQPCGHWAG